MPTVIDPTLSISVTGNDATLTVDYQVRFSAFEQWLAERGGLSFHDHITAYGWDGGDTYGPSIQSVDDGFGRPKYTGSDKITMQPDGRDLVIDRHYETTVPRSDLQEDLGGDEDEIRVNVRVHSPLPPEFTDDLYTAESVLLG